MGTMTNHSHFNCLDCAVDTGAIGEYYMLRDEVWKKINPDVDGMLCVGCAEKRLGRTLTSADFIPAGANEIADKSPRLLSRMQADLNRHKRAVIYARVSRDEQASNYSLDTQIEACDRYAAEHGFEIVARLKEDYTGASPIESRPEGYKAHEMLHDELADVLIAYRIDRIVRPPEDGDEWDMPILIRGLSKLRKEIHVCNRGELKTDFASLLIAMLDARKAGEERRDILERTTRGAQAKARSGKVVGNGKSPYGYRYVRTSADPHKKVDALEICEPEAQM